MYRKFTDTEINSLYNKHIIKDDNYFLKYNYLPFEYNNKKWKWEGKDFPRIMAILDFKDWIEKYNIKDINSLLSTDESDPELEYINSKKIDFIPYQNGINDLHSLNLENKDYDFVIINQTIEHLYNPLESIKNIYNHLKKDGYFFTSVPTINIPHLLPFHFYGVTPIGLVMLMESVGFEVLEVGFWGNKDYINYIFNHHNWPDYRILSKNGMITNEKNNYVQCWCLVKK